MAIQKAVIEQKDLNAMYSDGSYVFRYRIISDDRSRFSEWSPKYFVNANKNLVQLIGSPDIMYSFTPMSTKDSAGETVLTHMSLSWTKPERIDTPKFDIYVKFSNESVYSFYSTVSSTAALIEAPLDLVDVGSVEAVVLVESFPKAPFSVVNETNPNFVFKTQAVPITSSTSSRVDGGVL